MSADTTVVIAAYRFVGASELAYTATVVQAAYNIHDPENEFCVKWAKANFIEKSHPWFTGVAGLSRAKQFANLIAAEAREKGILEYEDRPIIEIGRDRLYLLSRKGNRVLN